MAAADVLLFYVPAINRGPSGKIYEYLASGRPILCVAGVDNGASRLVEELSAGTLGGAWGPSGDRVCDRAALSAVGSDDNLGVSPDVRTETLRRFSRPALARQLASVLEAAATERGPSRAGAAMPGACRSPR